MISESERKDLDAAWTELLNAFENVERICRRNSGSSFNQYKAYGFNTVSAGLGVGDALPCPAPVCELVETLLEQDQEDDPDVGTPAGAHPAHRGGVRARFMQAGASTSSSTRLPMDTTCASR